MKPLNQGAASNRRPAGQLDGSGNLSATVAAGWAFPAAVAELGLGVCVMLRLISFILATGFLTGCATRPQSTEQAARSLQRSTRAKHSYSVGMNRNEVRAELADSWLLVSASRPPAGWSGQVSPPAGNFAAMFERSHPGAVEACDAYWVGHTNAPSTYSGKWLNYFYFDRNDKLIGFDRWVIN